MTVLWESMLDFTRYGFLSRAMAAALLLAIICGALSPLVVIRRLAFSADGLAHASLGGIAAGFVLMEKGAPPGPANHLVGLVFTCLVAVAIATLNRRGRVSGDTAIGACCVAAFASGTLLLALLNLPTGHLEHVFFGSLLAVHSSDILWLALLLLMVLGGLALQGRHLAHWTFDEDLALANGIPVHALRLMLMLFLAATVVLSAKVVGILMVTTLLILPGAVGCLMARSFTTILSWAIGSAVLASSGGLLLSNLGNVPPGPITVLLLFLLFVAAFASHRHFHPSTTTPPGPFALSNSQP